MSCFVSHTTIDCRNAYELSEWWKPVLGYVDLEDDPNEPGHRECMIQDPDSGHRVLFIEVPEAKAAKNRLHLDLRPREGRAGRPRGQRVLRAALRARTRLGVGSDRLERQGDRDGSAQPR